METWVPAFFSRGYHPPSTLLVLPGHLLAPRWALETSTKAGAQERDLTSTHLASVFERHQQDSNPRRQPRTPTERSDTMLGSQNGVSWCGAQLHSPKSAISGFLSPSPFLLLMQCTVIHVDFDWFISHSLGCFMHVCVFLPLNFKVSFTRPNEVLYFKMLARWANQVKLFFSLCHQVEWNHWPPLCWKMVTPYSRPPPPLHLHILMCVMLHSVVSSNRQQHNDQTHGTQAFVCQYWCSALVVCAFHHQCQRPCQWLSGEYVAI